MKIVLVILLAIVLVALALLGLAAGMLLKKGGRFPNTHVGGNRHLKRQGIHCYQTQDRMEQMKVEKEIDYKKIKISIPPN